jgi:Leucine-rich repeat (LRR) protein
VSLTPLQIERGFWYHDPENGFPPEYVSYPEEYQGGEKLNLACTQLDLSSHRQKKLTEAWCALLPELPDVKTLWFNSRVNQPLFEAACEMENLEGLYVKWSGIKSIASLPKLKKLKYLHIGSSAQVESMEPLREMTGLQALEIENFKKIRKLDPIAELTQLEGLSICGSTWTIQVVESLEPLRKLTNLKYLYLIALRSLDKTLRPIAEIKSLVTLRTAWWWKVEEFAYLRDKLPNLRYGNPLEEDAIREFARQ